MRLKYKATGNIKSYIFGTRDDDGKLVVMEDSEGAREVHVYDTIKTFYDEFEDAE